VEANRPPSAEDGTGGSLRFVSARSSFFRLIRSLRPSASLLAAVILACICSAVMSLDMLVVSSSSAAGLVLRCSPAQRDGGGGSGRIRGVEIGGRKDRPLDPNKVTAEGCRLPVARFGLSARKGCGQVIALMRRVKCSRQIE
jgi:hypothetical protein